MCTAAEPAVPASTGQALAMVRAGLGCLAGCDAASLGTASLGTAALAGLEGAEAQHTAARARSAGGAPRPRPIGGPYARRHRFLGLPLAG